MIDNQIFNPFGDLPEMPQQTEEGDELTPEERMDVALATATLGGCMTVMALVIAVLLCLLLGSCATKERVVERSVVRTDTVYQVMQQRDSIYLSDSIYVSDFVRNDTVWSIRDRWHTRYVERTRVDTLYQARTDTVTQVVETVRDVPQELTAWQRWRLSLANIMLYTAAIAAAVWIWKRRHQ